MRAVITGFLAINMIQPASILAESDSLWKAKPKIELNGFIDAFYSYDGFSEQHIPRHAILYNHNRQNETNINLAFIGVDVKHAKYRAKIKLQTGTYVVDNYQSEPSALRPIHEANAGIALNKKNSLWLDMGIFASHVGLESAISTLNPTLTRSLTSEFSPYYLSGIRLTYHVSSKLTLLAIKSNGWQRIQKPTNESRSIYGTQVQYKPTEKTKINWSTLAGIVVRDAKNHTRYFNNIFITHNISQRLFAFGVFDVGFESVPHQSDVYRKWIGGTGILRFKMSEKWFTAIRYEHFYDETAQFVPVNYPFGNTSYPSNSINGYSANVDFLPNDFFQFRMEIKHLKSKHPVFGIPSNAHTDCLILTTSIAIGFGNFGD